MSKTYKIYIAHSWDHMNDLRSLRSHLENRGYFNVEFEEVTPDEAINSSNEAYVKSRLRYKIKNSDVVLGLAGVYASYSEWIRWELDTANELEIPVIGVIPWGNDRVSSIVSARSKKDVRWNTDSIVSAIREYA